MLNQFPASWAPRQWISRHDGFNLIPQWTFFAPNPGTTDYYLLYRVKAESWGPWSPAVLSPPRGLTAAVWNPDKRKTKTLTDFVQALVRLAPFYEASPRSLCLSTPYLALLRYVVGLAGTVDGAERCQFAIVSVGTRTDRANKIMFWSEEHPLASAHMSGIDSRHAR